MKSARRSLLGWPNVGVAGLVALAAAAPWWWRLADNVAGHPVVHTADADVCHEPAREAAPSTVAAEVKPTPSGGQELSFGTTEPRVARIAPPVAERIELDPSIAETPALPEPGSSATPPAPLEGPLPWESRQPVEDTQPELIEKQPGPRTLLQSTWPTADLYYQELEALVGHPLLDEWVRTTRDLLDALSSTSDWNDERTATVLDDLDQQLIEARQMVKTIPTLNARARILRISYSLQRRMAIWRQVQTILTDQTQVAHVDRNPQEVLLALRQVDQRLQTYRDASPWRSYLMLDELYRSATRRQPTSPEQRSQLAREVLNRMDSSDLSEQQRQFFAMPEFQQLQSTLRYWVVEPVDYRRLMVALERYELSGSSTDAQDVTDAYQILRWSPDEAVAKLGERINTHYRNANVRVAISDELINRLLPSNKAIEEPVNDHLLGARVFGKSRTSARVRVVLVPDRFKWRMGFEALGELSSETEASRGPATFYNEGSGRYHARKLLHVDRRGIQLFDAEAAAATDSALTGMETDFDALPVLNLLARAIARQQYDSQQPEARWQMQGIVENRARRRLDAEVEQQIERVRTDFDRMVTQPLHKLNLDPTPVDMRTTSDRLIVRYRVAGSHQLAAFTPRPQAPSDSLLSVQFHQSAVNNVLRQLNLDDRETNLAELYLELAEAMERHDVQLPHDFPEDVTIRFAKQDAVTIHCDDNRILVTLKLAELSQGSRHRWRDFVVRVAYSPAIEGMDAGLVRDGYVMLKGRRLNLRDEIALRGIFSKVFGRNPDVHFISKSLMEHPNLTGAVITQFTIRDGWIGIAVGPMRTATHRYLTDTEEE